jgi:DNA-binding CsgD family transcriptional regulator
MPLRPTSRNQTGARIVTGLARAGDKGITRVDSPLYQGRQSFDRRGWATAYAQLSAADRETPLEPEDRERLATAAHLIGRDADCAELWARAHHDLIIRGDLDRAARCAFWLGMTLFDKGQSAPGMGWIARARRLLDEHQRDCVERGYLLLPAAIGNIAQGKLEMASSIFDEAIAIAERFGDTDLRALARQGKGRALAQLGRIAEGVSLLDEAMASVMADEVSPMVAGIVYCSVISACFETFDLRRAHEWTAALGQWCESQPELVHYRGACLVHRAEIMVLHGAWPAAMTEAMRARQRYSEAAALPGQGAALYQLAEIHRLRGQFTEAEEFYGLASQHGKQPEPGLALLRLAQGQEDASAAAIRRALDEAREPRSQSRILGAFVEVMLAVGDVSGARAAADRLSAIAAAIDAPFIRAVAACATGAVLLAEQDPRAALVPLRDSWTIWRELDAPYEAARTTVLLGVACRALGDHDAAAMEFDAARHAFQRLGAAPDLARLATLSRSAQPTTAGGLTAREVEVLRLVATGRTNRAIAQALRISDKTVARHLSNIFTKLDVSTRAAATAYAYQHGLA